MRAWQGLFLGVAIASGALVGLARSHVLERSHHARGATPPRRPAHASDTPASVTRTPSGVGQVAPSPPPSAEPPTTRRCPEDMALVEGDYCPEVRQDCLAWDDRGRRRCLRFLSPSVCLARRRPMAFCIDRYEWPDREGARPEVMVTWYQAAAMCRARGRRLCTESEWTFACEGEAMLPYPYGYNREPGACTVDHFARAPDRALLHDRRRAAAEAARVYEATPSGAAARCVSPFGVYDLAGNVDEWTINERGRPYHSSLKGGWWGRIRGRCRPATRAHGETFSYYQIGFRCCAPLPATEREGAVREGDPAPVRRRHRRHRRHRSADRP